MMRRAEAGDGGGEGRKAAAPPKRARKPSGAGKKANPEPLLFRFLTDETINAVRRDFPGWDVHALKAEFDVWIDGQVERVPQDYQAAFYGFVKRHHARNKHQLGR